MRQRVSPDAEKELAGSSLFLWASGQTAAARLALWTVVAAVVVLAVSGLLMLAVESAWPALVGGSFLVALVLAYVILMFVHAFLFEAALEADHLLPRAEKVQTKARLLAVPLGRLRLRRCLIELAEARATQRGSA